MTKNPSACQIDQVTQAVLKHMRSQHPLNTQMLALLQDKLPDEIKHSLYSGTCSLYLIVR